MSNPAATRDTLSRSVSGQRSGLRALAQCCVVFLAAVAFYVSLYGELPYHDAARFIAQVESGRFVWDIGHIFLQPATLLWHEYLGFGEAAEASQKHINTFATALGLAVFYYTLLRLGISLPRRITATILVAVSFGLMTLTPSAHMKMLAFPLLNGALLFGVLWERAPSLGSRRGHVYLLAMALLLAFAASLLASSSRRGALRGGGHRP